MPSIVIFNESNNRCLQFLPSLDPFPFLNRTDVLIFDDTTTQSESEVMNLLATVPVTYTKKTGNPQISEMTQVEKDQVDAALLQAARVRARAQAVRLIDAVAANPLLMRAIADIVKDEINNLRHWDMNLKTAVAAATTLANLKTGVAALPNLPDRTFEDLRTAIINKINSGSVNVNLIQVDK